MKFMYLGVLVGKVPALCGRASNFQKRNRYIDAPRAIPHKGNNKMAAQSIKKSLSNHWGTP